MIFNRDMGRRLADLHQALEAGEQIEVQSLPPHDNQGRQLPARVQLTFGERSFCFANDMAAQVADQVAANGFPVFAERLRPEPN